MYDGYSDPPPETPQAGRSPYAQPPLRRLPWLLAVMAGLLAVLIVPYFVAQIQYAITRGQQRAKAEVAREILGQLPEPQNRFAVVAKAIEPSVVGVETEQVVSTRAPGDEWGFLFRGPPQFRAQGEGSGVIMDKQGYVVTNYHVIGQADHVTVKLADGRTVESVRIVGADPLSDIAVLKIDTPDLMAARWGDSDALEVGDSVLAVGNPFRLAHTVTAGIISAKGRRGIVRDVDYQDFLQTDAAVNPGNSGGPLVNMNGEVVGINTAIYGDRYQGISFAIPSRIAKDVYERLKNTGKVERGWLGVELQAINETLAERLRLKSTKGALVARVLPGSPAEQSGLEPGDVVVKWNTDEISDASDLSLAVARTPIGSKAKAEVVRDGEKRTLEVVVGERPPRLRRE